MINNITLKEMIRDNKRLKKTTGNNRRSEEMIGDFRKL